MSSGRGLFERYGRLIGVAKGFFGLLPESVVRFLLVSCRHIPWKVGLLLRYLCINRLAVRCGNNVAIHPSVHILYPERVSLGSNVSVHPMCYLDAFGGVEIGDDVSIAHATSIVSANHTWGDLNAPIKYNAVVGGRIYIFNDVWIGCGVRVLSGSRVQSRTVIAAGAVYKDSVGEGACLWGGVPAKLLKRFDHK